jgi:hypothetical protein
LAFTAEVVEGAIFMQMKGRPTPERAKAVQHEMQVHPRTFAGTSFCLGSLTLALVRKFVQGVHNKIVQY